MLELIKKIIITAMSSSDSFLKQKVPTLHRQDDVHSGLEVETAFPTNMTSNDLHQGLVPSDETQNSLEEAFHAGIIINNRLSDHD